MMINSQINLYFSNYNRIVVGAMKIDQQQNDSYKDWLENAGFLYDRLLVQKLKWPSLTFQWLPYRLEQPQQTTYRCLYATHSSGAAPSQHIYVAQVFFPTLRPIDSTPTDMPASKLKTLFKFTHDQEINRARVCPNNQSLISAKTDEGPISIFKMGQEYPIYLLKGNLGSGFALQWSQQGILSGDENGQACYWRQVQDECQSISYFKNNPIGDIKIVEQGLAGIVGDGGMLSFWDLRSNKIVQNAFVTDEHNPDLYCLSVNKIHNNFLLTGGQDQTIKIFDRRNLRASLHKFQGHEDSVMSVEWSNVNPSMFASGSSDKKVKIWDLMRVGFQIPKDLGGTDQLLFTHQGHKGSVNDLGWNPYEMILGSVQEDENTVQFYEISNNIHELQYQEDIDYIREQCFG